MFRFPTRHHNICVDSDTPFTEPKQEFGTNKTPPPRVLGER